MVCSVREGLIHPIMPIKKLNPASVVWGNVHSVTGGKIASRGPCRLHDSVRKGDRRVLTFTTPAPEPGGRGAPEGSLQRCSESEAPVAGRPPTVRAMAIRAAHDVERRDASCPQP